MIVARARPYNSIVPTVLILVPDTCTSARDSGRAPGPKVDRDGTVELELELELEWPVCTLRLTVATVSIRTHGSYARVILGSACHALNGTVYTGTVVL